MPSEVVDNLNFMMSGLSKVEISENTGLILTRGGFDMC